MDKQVRAYLAALRENGAVVNTTIAIACATGVVISHDSNLLQCNGGHILLTKHLIDQAVSKVFDGVYVGLARGVPVQRQTFPSQTLIG